MTRFLTAVALIALPIAAVSAQAPMPASTYVMKAGAGDLYEKTSSQILLETTTNPKLKSFAQMMIADHTKSTEDVKAAAMAANVKVAPPKLDPMGAKNVAALRAAKGTARDRLYVTQQKAAHAKALTLQQGYAANGTVPGLKTVAAGIVPVVQTHITELQTM
jgi:putative membrane protein